MFIFVVNTLHSEITRKTHRSLGYLLSEVVHLDHHGSKGYEKKEFLFIFVPNRRRQSSASQLTNQNINKQVTEHRLAQLQVTIIKVPTY